MPRQISLLLVAPFFLATGTAPLHAQCNITDQPSLDFLLGTWTFESAVMSADRSVNRMTGIVRVDAVARGESRGVRESWSSKFPFSTPDFGFNYHLFICSDGMWLSKYTPQYPPVAWPELTRLSASDTALVVPTSDQSDPTGDHKQRGWYTSGDDFWSWTLQRSYDGGVTFFTIQSVEATRVSHEWSHIREHAAEPLPGSVETVMSGFDGSRGLAMDPQGNVYIAARFDPSGSVPIHRITPDGHRTLVADSLAPAGLAWSQGYLYVHAHDVEGGRIVRVDSHGRVEHVADAPGDALAVAPDGTTYTVDQQNGNLIAINTEGRPRVLVDSLGGLGMAYDVETDVLYVSNWWPGVIHAVTPEGETAVVNVVPGYTGSDAAWIAEHEDWIYVTGFGADQVFRVSKSSSERQLVAGSGLPGQTDGTTATARFRSPNGIAVSPDGRTIWVAELGETSGGGFPDQALRKITLH